MHVPRAGTCEMNVDELIQLIQRFLSISELVEPIIYFGTGGEGLQSYSVAISEVNNVVTSTQVVFGVTYDFLQNKIYWSGYSSRSDKIWLGNRDGTHVKTLLSTDQCKLHYCIRSYQTIAVRLQSYGTLCRMLLIYACSFDLKMEVFWHWISIGLRIIFMLPPTKVIS